MLKKKEGEGMKYSLKIVKKLLKWEVDLQDKL